ncbi:MAG: FAD-dependent oxidoreductase [Bacillota bacterium]
MPERTAVVVGGGPAGCAAAVGLAAAGVGVTLLERGPGLGGKARGYACKATDACRKCHVCLGLEQARKVAEDPRITVLVNADIERMVAAGDGYRLTVSSGGSAAVHGRPGASRLVAPAGEDGTLRELAAAAVIIATGHAAFAAGAKPALSWGRLPGVMTTAELELALQGGALASAAVGFTPRDVAFIQCVGSRDEEHEYCSRACCMVSLRLAALLMHQSPGTKLTIYHMDFQRQGKAAAAEVARLEAAGLRLVRAMPSRVWAAGGALHVRCEASQPWDPVQHDLVVLAVGMGPQAQTLPLGLPVDDAGFLTLGEDEASRGLFAAGTCAQPSDIAEAVAGGHEAALKALVYLSGRGGDVRWVC